MTFPHDANLLISEQGYIALRSLYDKFQVNAHNAIASPKADAVQDEQFAYQLRNRRARISGKVGVVNLHGPLLTRGDFFSDFFGLANYEALESVLRGFEKNEAIEAVILNLDTPGGYVNGLSALSEVIAEVKQKKRIYAYVGDNALSAGYYIASQADRIFMADTGTVGSIGAIISFCSHKDEEITNIVSENAPLKNKDPKTAAGKKQYQEVVNAAEKRFIEAVANGRGVSTDHVIENYGAGAIVTAEKALSLGMADEIISFNKLLLQLNQNTIKVNKSNPQGEIMTKEVLPETGADKAQAAAKGDEVSQKAEVIDTAALKAEAINGERARVSAILFSEEGKARPSLAEKLVTEGVDAKLAAVLLSAAAAEAPAKAAKTGLSEAMAKAENNPDVSAGNGAQAEPPKTAVQSLQDPNFIKKVTETMKNKGSV